MTESTSLPVYRIEGMEGSILEPKFHYSDLASFLERAYQYGTPNKVVICHPVNAHVFESIGEGPWGKPPIVLTSPSVHKKSFYFMDADEWEQIKEAASEDTED